MFFLEGYSKGKFYNPSKCNIKKKILLLFKPASLDGSTLKGAYKGSFYAVFSVVLWIV